MRFFERSKYIHISLIDLLHRRIAFFAAGERFFVEFLGFQVGLTDQHQRIVEIIREFVRSQFERLAESLQRFRRIAQFVVNSTQACPQLGIVRIVGNTLLDIRNNGIGIFARLRIQHDQLFEDLVVFRIFAKAGNQCLFRFFEILLRPVAVIQIIVSLPVAFVTVGDRIVQVFDPLVEFAGERIQVAGIETADRITTVSPTYAAQLRESAYAAGLDSVVRSIQWKFSGVLNGIDMVSYDPECDPDLPARYTAAESEGKTLCKAALQQELGLAQEEGTPVLSMVTRLVGHKGVDLVCQALDGIMATGCQLVVLGSGDGGYENFFRHAQNRYPGRLCAWIGYNEGLSRRIYAGSDLFLMPSKSEPCGLSQMIAMRYGAVPIVRQTGGLNDTVRSCQVGQPDGNGYVFAAYDAGAMLDTIGQAVGLYHGDAEGFRMVRRRGMEGDFSWDRSAGAYRNIYGKLLGR